MTKEQKFFQAVKDIFIGANVEGHGGFINLMRIKSNYYSQIERILKNDIESALKKYPLFRNELFDKLYSFFSRYFSESGSIYFNSTPFHNNIYEKVYTADRDLVLFWKTQMLYYVKTDRIFRSMPVEFNTTNPSKRGELNTPNPSKRGELNSLKFYFDASSIENKKANEKRSLIFELKEVSDDNTIVFFVYYSEMGRRTKKDEILKLLKKDNIKISEEDLERAFKIFEKQSEVDFFINKNAKLFLQEQFMLWSYQYFWIGGKEWSSERVNELQILKNIAFNIIDFIAQFENELVKIWKKPKFVKNSNYVITLDRLWNTPNPSKRGELNSSDTSVKEKKNTSDFSKKSELNSESKANKLLIPKWYEIPYNPKLKERARELRKAGNLAEVLFWKQVKNKQIEEIDFDRQKIIGNYIVDFYCKELGFVVEIDGRSHDDKIDYDLERDEYIKSFNIDILHFKDENIKNNLEEIIQLLKKYIQERKLFVENFNKKNNPDNLSFKDTIDSPLIEGRGVLKKILLHSNLPSQIHEWKELSFINGDISYNDIINEDLTGEILNHKYQYLPIDTKYFKEYELEILSLFENIDEALNGWLIKSENFQALNTLLPKFNDKIQTIYIDPPFNLESSDQFLYRTNYKDANWATLLENRLRLAKDWLNEKGSIFVRCDYNGNWIVRGLLNEIIDANNSNREIILRKANSQGPLNNFNPANESLLFYPKTENYFFNSIFKYRNRDIKWVNCLSPKQNKSFNTVLINGKKYYAPENQHWRFSQEKFNLLNSQGRLRINEKTGIPQYLESEIIPLDTNWTDVQGYSFTLGFQTENAEVILQRIIECSSADNEIVLDFFLGSGTTTAVAQKLGRKWIGVEMGGHFYSVVLPRMKKVLWGEMSGISKELAKETASSFKNSTSKKGNLNVGGFFKYYELEQYEETLARCKYKDSDLFSVQNRSSFQEYVFLKDEKLLDAIEIDYKNKKVNVVLDNLYENIDFAETLSNLTGKWIKKITPLTPLKEGNYEVEFEDGRKIDLGDIDYKLLKPLIWWE